MKYKDAVGDHTRGDEVRVLTLSDEDVEAARRLLIALADADSDPGKGQDRGDLSELRLRKATASLERRRTRARFFKRGMVGEPPFDLLLTLYVEGASKGFMSISELARLADLPLSTSTRWLQYLEDEKLVSRDRDREDRRVMLVSLTNTGREKLDSFFDMFGD